MPQMSRVWKHIACQARSIAPHEHPGPLSSRESLAHSVRVRGNANICW